ncbi:MAG: Lar family restriction alleviation protein [Halioglobus sp.]|nr:Lar family restriction alleviation protein [Halioglobus sp.]
MSEELKPCPFCGSEAKHDVDADHHGEFHTIGCSNDDCCAWWLFYTIHSSDVQHAISQWNRRPPAGREVVDG